MKENNSYMHKQKTMLFIPKVWISVFINLPQEQSLQVVACNIQFLWIPKFLVTEKNNLKMLHPIVLCILYHT